MFESHRRRRWLLVGALAMAAAVATSCNTGDDRDADSGPTAAPSKAATSTAPPTPDEPAGVIAIGHSGLTGENSNPEKPARPALENSWATGTSPEVNSIYLRLVALRPETEGRVANTASGGAHSRELASQAARALQIVPKPALAIIQTIDADIECEDGNDAATIERLGKNLAAALDVINEASPETRILVVGQFGRPSPDFVRTLIATHPDAKSELTGSGPCDFINPAGELVDAGFATLTAIIDGFELEQARVCASVPHCSDDQDSAKRWIDDLESLTSDLNHRNVHGNARAAELIWPEVAALLNAQ